MKSESQSLSSPPHSLAGDTAGAVWPVSLELQTKGRPTVIGINQWCPNFMSTVSGRVQKTHHKFMRASYMKHFAKFLVILHHNASFFNFCFIINFGFIKNLLHIFEILKYYCCLCLRSLCCWLSLLRVVRFFAITMHGLAYVYQKVNNCSFKVVWQ